MKLKEPDLVFHPVHFLIYLYSRLRCFQAQERRMIWTFWQTRNDEWGAEQSANHEYYSENVNVLKKPLCKCLKRQYTGMKGRQKWACVTIFTSLGSNMHRVCLVMSDQIAVVQSWEKPQHTTVTRLKFWCFDSGRLPAIYKASE